MAIGKYTNSHFTPGLLPNPAYLHRSGGAKGMDGIVDRTPCADADRQRHGLRRQRRMVRRPAGLGHGCGGRS